MEVVVKAPMVPYREAIKTSTKVQGKYKKQTGGKGQFGDTWIEISPLKRGDCKPILIEPVMKIEIVVPSDHVGDVMGTSTLNAVRFRVLIQAMIRKQSAHMCRWRRS